MKSLIFSAEMALANVRGLKTETRRLARLEGANYESERWFLRAELDLFTFVSASREDALEVVPRLHPGEVFYQKETWRRSDDATSSSPPHYRADPDEDVAPGCWKSPLFLRAGDARFFARIVAVTCQRLRDITEADATAEGMQPYFERWPSMPRDSRLITGELAADAEHRATFAVLWDTLNGKDERFTWNSNPWVWVYRYETISREEALRG